MTDKMCVKVYVDKDGKTFANLPEDPSAIVAREFRFSNGEVRRMTPKDYPKNILQGAILTGLGYVGSAAMNSADGNVKEAVKLFDARAATLMDGKWSSRGGTGGPRLDNLIVSAILAVAAEQNREVDENKVRDYMSAVDIEDGGADIAEIRKVRGKRRAEWLARADVNAAYEKIKAERQSAKSAEAAAEAKDAPTPSGDAFASF